MADELQLINDGDGVAVIGELGVVDRFLAANGLESRELPLAKLGSKAGFASGAVQAVSDMSSQSGRWIQLTQDSAEALKHGNTMAGSHTGTMRAILTSDGKIARHLEFIKSPANMLSNPAVLAGTAGMMAQFAMQQTIDEITDYLKKIDKKVDDILHAQKHAVLSQMIGVGLVLDDALIKWDEVGTVSETTWNTVQNSPQIIAQTQAYALKQLSGLVEKLEGEDDIGKLLDTLRDAETKVREWLVVIARSFQLQDALEILEIERILNANPEQLDDHRRAVKIARQRRMEKIASTTEGLLGRINHAANLANEKVLLNPLDSPRVISASSEHRQALQQFHEHLDIAFTGEEIEGRRWLNAAVDARDRVLERGAEGFDEAKRVGGEGFDAARRAGTGGIDAVKRIGGRGLDQAKNLGGRFRLPDRFRRSQDEQPDSDDGSSD